jgi:NhaP-type Na+/H+ or K+/H+ antiporter
MHLLGPSLAARSAGPLFLPIFLFGGLFGLCAFVFWVWLLVDVLTRETDEGNSRLVWTLVIVFTHWVGALIYLLARRPERIRKLGR